MEIKYLECPNYIPLDYLPLIKGERSFELKEDISIILSNNYKIIIKKGTITDLSSIPNWAWSIFKPIDKAFIADLIHDYLWINKENEINHFKSIYKARQFADKERLIWRNSICPDKKIKNYITHTILRLIGGFYYSQQFKIPN